MADLCGGHPADVLIALCLAAQTLTVPGMKRGGWVGGKGGRAARSSPGCRLSRRGRPGMPGHRSRCACVCPRGHTCLPWVGCLQGMARCVPDVVMEVLAWSRQD